MIKKIIPIILSGLAIFAGGIYMGLGKGEIVGSPQIQFDVSDITFLEENAVFVTSTNDIGETIKTGLRVPIKYNFPVATSTGYLIEQIDGEMAMTLDGYDMCRQKGQTSETCLAELRSDIEQNIQAFQNNIRRDLEDLKRKDFRKELDNISL